MKQIIHTNDNKEKVFQSVANYLQELRLPVSGQDSNRPWGGFFVIDENYTADFIAEFFPYLAKQELAPGTKLSPKILVVAPENRLSWQYHLRRAEIWKLIEGKAGLITSDTDEQGEIKQLAIGEVINLKQGERHRLIGLDNWGIVAEIWQHTDASNPSNEDDIVRVQDDFGR
jgi:mannose-6-phosphate isomerase